MYIMNKLVLPFFVCVCVSASACAESLLKPASFPKTFDDLSFSERMQLKTKDYELYQAEYDENGICIKNCAYPGLNIKKELEKSEQDTQQAVEHSQQYEQENQHELNNHNIAVNQNAQTAPLHTQHLPINTQNIISSISSGTSSCADRNPDIPVGQKVPKGEPLKGRPYITSGYGPRTLFGKKGFHDGLDYRAVVGTPVYVTADGRVFRVVNDNICGKGLRIAHEDGTHTIYCHLSKQLFSKDDVVKAGCKIGETGNTGRSTGPHLHYGMRDYSGNKINPAAYTGRGKN